MIGRVHVHFGALLGPYSVPTKVGQRSAGVRVSERGHRLFSREAMKASASLHAHGALLALLLRAPT